MPPKTRYVASCCVHLRRDRSNTSKQRTHQRKVMLLTVTATQIAEAEVSLDFVTRNTNTHDTGHDWKSLTLLKVNG